MGAYGTGLALGALSNALGETFRGLAEGEEKAPDVEAKTLAAKQSREQFPLQQRLLGSQASGLEEQTRASQINTRLAQEESPARMRLLGAQAERLLRPEPITTPFGMYMQDSTGIKPWLVPKVEQEAGFTKITDPTGRITYERGLTPERVAAANAALSKIDVNQPHTVISTLGQYRDILGDAPLQQYMNYMMRKYSADTRAKAMLDVARLRAAQGGRGQGPQETTKLRPPRPVNFTEGMQLNQEFSKALQFAAQKYTGVNGIGAFADPASGDVFDPDVQALVPKDFLLRKLMMQSGYLLTPFWDGKQWAFTGAMHAPAVEETIRGPVQQPQAPFILNWGSEEDDGG